MTRQQYRVRLILSVSEDDDVEDEMEVAVALRGLLRERAPDGWQIEKLEVDPWD